VGVTAGVALRAGVGRLVGLGLAALGGVADGVGMAVGVADCVASGVMVLVAIGEALGVGVSEVGSRAAADVANGAGPSNRTRPLLESATTNSQSAAAIAVTA